ncbi:MAG: ABC transporter permease subunit, partial [Acetobacteraceae bacterium]
MINFLTVLVLGLLLGGIYGLVSIGLNIIFGVIRVVNFAHGETLMLAMYATYFAYDWAGINPYFAILLVAPLMFVFGVLVQRLLMQPLMT